MAKICWLLAASDMGDDVASRTDSLLLTGTNPASEILRLADQREYDMIVIGNRGLSGLKEYTAALATKCLPVQRYLCWL